MAAVFPAAGEVKQGVTYGPTTGTEFTGTRTSPAVSNVKNGIQYGAGGTEFTGTGFTSTGLENSEPLLEL